MNAEGIIGFILLVVIIVFVIVGLRLSWRMRSDNGYNMGRNYMRDLGFSDDDIKMRKKTGLNERYADICYHHVPHWSDFPWIWDCNLQRTHRTDS